MRSDWFKLIALGVQSTELMNAYAIHRVCFENKAKFVRKVTDCVS